MLAGILRFLKHSPLSTWCWGCHCRFKHDFVNGWMSTSNTLKNGNKDLSATEFQKVAEYFEWPRDQMCFVLDESLYVGPQRCDTTVVRLKEDGYVYFFVLFTVKRFDNVNRSYQFIMPIKLKKFEETF